MTTIRVKQSVMKTVVSQRTGKKIRKRVTEERSVTLRAGDQVELDVGLRNDPVRGEVMCTHKDFVCVEVPELIEMAGIENLTGKGCYGTLKVPFETNLFYVEDGKNMSVDYGIRRVE